MRAGIDQVTKAFKDLEKQAVKTRVYWTFGCYNGVIIIEATSEKEAIKAFFLLQDVIETVTLVAVRREEAIKLI